MRMYFWVQGAPHDRPGGPWWARDFWNEEDRQDFFDAVKHTLYAYTFTQGGVDELLDTIRVVPPATAEIVIMSNGEEVGRIQGKGG